jgi:hypothetical protein
MAIDVGGHLAVREYSMLPLCGGLGSRPLAWTRHVADAASPAPGLYGHVAVEPERGLT